MNQRREYGAARKLGLLGVLAGSATLLAGCDVNPPENGFFKLLRFGWPMGVTPEAEAMGNFWVWVWVAAWIIGIAVWGLTIYSMVGFTAKKAKKAGKDEFPRQTAYNVPLELVLTIVPILIVMSLFFFTVQTQDKVTAMDKDPEVVVDVTAFQWNWKFGYANVSGDLMGGEDYEGRREATGPEVYFTGEEHSGEGEQNQKDYPVHGQSKADLSYLYFNEVETLGTTDEVPVLVLPTDTPIEFDLASADVVHSFWVPEFLFKRDAFPHPEANKSNRRFQIEEISSAMIENRPVDNPRDSYSNAFVGRCAEMCGTYHAMMNFEIRAVSREAFAEYMQFRLDNPEATNAEALEAIGEDPFAVSTSPFNAGRLDTRDMGDREANTVDLNQ
ncbi:cytochrome c oxidase subunit II [Corynebacterium xerosis]|uniref:aa3-type cytochrome oxidase subunit II n=1 Tax=Corynebacterium xerosis TaxID=1725 RepID=UPI000EB097D0|nr:cytochrome c oxidase subunit II [Corynebacterium xerosis]AYJ32117.1 cytochrome c oxidase subunit II [Corynebacterium xerosis]